MRRLIAALVLVAATLLTATPADAFWRHHGWGGWGHRGWGGYYGGYRGYGWGGYRGYGWGGYRGYGWGYPGYGGYGVGYRGYGYGGYGLGYPGYGYGGYGGGYYPGNYYSPWYGCYNGVGYGAGTTVSVGYPGYGLYGATYAPSTNLIVSSAAPARPVIAPAPTKAAPVPALNAVPIALVVQKFLGLKDIHPVSLARGPASIATAPAPAPLRNLGEILARVSNVESRRKAERLLTEGDELFRAQNFHSALQKYKLAASTAPDLTEAYWRKGHALVATHNYDLATTAFKRAIALTEDLGRNGFRLSDIYAGATMTKTQHLESLAEWAISHRNSSDPYFLLGLFLTYDEQPARAERFFQKASDLAGISGGHIAVFLDAAEPAPMVRPDAIVRPAASMPVVPISVGTEI